MTKVRTGIKVRREGWMDDRGLWVRNRKSRNEKEGD